MSPYGKGILLAPFSNSHIRDWPIGHWSDLIGHVLDGPLGDERILVIGTPNQRHGANEIVRRYPATKVANVCGRLPWSQVVTEIRNARCVVGNNSGVSHLSAFFERPTVCVFGGSHNRAEWRPSGASVVVVSRAIGCSPCQLDHGAQSPYDKACLRLIDPAAVAQAMILAVRRMDPSNERDAQ